MSSAPMSFRDFLQRAILDPLLAGISGEDGRPLALDGFIADRADEFGSPNLSRRSIVQMPSGYDDGADSCWLVLETPRELFRFEFDALVCSLDGFNWELDRMAAGIEDWLAESDAAWGQRCHVPEIAVAGPDSEDPERAAPS